jgi:hypothetical protein
MLSQVPRPQIVLSAWKLLHISRRATHANDCPIALKAELLSRPEDLLEFRPIKSATAGVLSSIGLRLFTTAAGTQRSQVVVSVNSRAVTVVPAEFDGVVTDRADLLQPCPRNGNKISLHPMPLAQCTGTVSTQILLRVFSDVAIIPSDPNEALRFDMVNFSRIVRFQNFSL